ncbi:zinc-ribbon domain containing protein [Massilia pseudoviolaceinigra]|uniref:zinc-ribbon domain containing protein n=1 Tax=Massilia pseudoviolaceinigra TaxID=3057165 RepID=UPI002796BA1F|nr:zinc-ribbon domain containing protein [Massilia sp. CCM 9206]MDQ1922714.1 zinc-ribbon domain containing protein [Massilia sp. CCM 9206]
MKKKVVPPPATAPADPTQWSDKSQGTVAASFRKHYTDHAYRCRACRKDALFSAAEQKIAYEVRKTHINVQRKLCEACWRECHVVENKIAACEAQWAQSKPALARDAVFLSTWRALLLAHQRYGARENGAAKTMLQKLLDQAADVN